VVLLLTNLVAYCVHCTVGLLHIQHSKCQVFSLEGSLGLNLVLSSASFDKSLDTFASLLFLLKVWFTA